MNQIPKVKGNFQRLDDQDFLVLAQTIHSAMSENPYFKTPNPSLESLGTITDDFAEKLTASNRRGSPYDTAIKDEARVVLAELIHELSFYVNQVAKGKLSVLLSSGITLSSTYTKAVSPAKVKGLQIKDGRQSGQMVLSFEPQNNIRLYKYRFTKNKTSTGDLLWDEQEFNTTSSSNNLIAEVTPASTYYISVQAINSAGIGDWSDPVSWIAR